MKLSEYFDVTVKKQFDEAKTMKPNSKYCVHAKLSGGPGFVGFGECEVHKNVRYGGDFCDRNCLEYEPTLGTVRREVEDDYRDRRLEIVRQFNIEDDPKMQRKEIDNIVNEIEGNYEIEPEDLL